MLTVLPSLGDVQRIAPAAAEHPLDGLIAVEVDLAAPPGDPIPSLAKLLLGIVDRRRAMRAANPKQTNFAG